MNKENEEQPEESQIPEKANVPEIDSSGRESVSEEKETEAEKPEVKPATDQQKASDKESKPVEETKKSKETAAVEGSEVPEFIEKVISINRITKVTKGGKKLSFSALVVVGDTQGNVGYSLSKAAEVSIAIRKAMGIAKKNMIKIPMHGTTIPHEIIGQCSGSRVLLKPASDGTGVIASGPVRAVCDGAGIHNILTKCHRSNNPINVVKATINGLTRLKPMSLDIKDNV